MSEAICRRKKNPSAAHKVMLNVKQNGQRKTCAAHKKASPPPPPPNDKILATPLPD